MDALKVAHTMIEALEETKGEDIVLLDIAGISPFTDYFVIVSGTSHRMLRALMKAAQEKVREEHHLKTRTEGDPMDGWLLADYGDVILHVFSEFQRNNYALEELWEEGKILLTIQ